MTGSAGSLTAAILYGFALTDIPQERQQLSIAFHLI